MLSPTTKSIVKHKIKQLVWLHGVHILNTTGLHINVKYEETRLYNEWLGGQITLNEINEDIAEYLKMRAITK